MMITTWAVAIGIYVVQMHLPDLNYVDHLIIFRRHWHRLIFNQVNHLILSRRSTWLPTGGDQMPPDLNQVNHLVAT